MKPAPFDYYRPRTLDEALVAARRAWRRREAAGRRAEPDSGDEFPAGDAGGPRRSERARRARVHQGRIGGNITIGGMTRQRQIERSGLVAQRPADCRDDAAHRASGHSQSRHRRRKPGARRSCRRAAGGDAGVERAPCRDRQSGSHARSPRPIFSPACFRPRSNLASCSRRSRIPTAPNAAAMRSRRSRGGTATLRSSAWRPPFSSTDSGPARVRALRCSASAIGRCWPNRRAEALIGQRPSAELIRAAAEAAATQDIDPSSDIHASARYRRQLANVLTRRALERAFERARSA